MRKTEEWNLRAPTDGLTLGAFQGLSFQKHTYTLDPIFVIQSPASTQPIGARALAARIIALCAISVFAVAEMRAEEPLHLRIDQLLDAAHPAGQAAPANDADFLRRAYLSLHGVIPTAVQARAFFADAAPDKREKLIESLIASPQFSHWLALRFDVMLMERRTEKHVKLAPWREYLEASFAANKPWDQLVRELLSNDGADEKTRALARWCLEREGDSNALTREVGRIFLGRDMGCAQCHDHPRIDDYTQRDYAGLQAFFSRTYLFQPDEKKPAVLGEKADGETAYTSVFTKVSGATKPRLPGDAEISDPVIPPAEMWTVPPNDKDKNVRAIPKFSRRAQLVAVLGDGHHPAFRRNIANRLWSVVFGRGLVEPLDLDHSGNPPSNPALLDLLAESIATMKFDMKTFVRELALTRAFQRALDLPELPPEITKAVSERLPTLEQEAKAIAEAASTTENAFKDARTAMLEVQRAAEPPTAELKKQETAFAEAKKAADAAQAETKKVEDSLVAKRDVQKTLAEAAAKSNEAAAKVPEAAEVAQAAKTFQTKADQATGEIAALEKDAVAKKTDADARAQTVTGAQQAAATARTTVEEANRNIAAKQTALEAAAARQQAERTKATYAARLAAEVKAALAWASAEAADRPSRETASKTAAALAVAKQSADALGAEVNGSPAKLAALEAAANTAVADVAKTKEAMTAKGPAATTLAEAAAKAAEAAAKLPNDADIKNAAAALKTKSDAAAGEVASLQKTAGEVQAKSEAAAKSLADARSAAEKAKIDLAAVQQQMPALEEQATTARAKAAETATPTAAARDALAAAWGPSFAARDLVPLLPEQLCWSVMQATGVLDQLRAQSTDEWDKKNPLSDADKADAAKQAARTAGIEQLLRDKIRPHEDQYIRAFGGAPGAPQTDFFATPEQALYFENGGVLRGWAASLAGRAGALPDPKAMAEELYLNTLTRLPDATEVTTVASTVAARPPEKKTEALTDLAWALMTSTEFRFLH